MQSSYSLIKKDRALSGDSKRISTEYFKENKQIEDAQEISEEHEVTSDEAKAYIENYENLGQKIIEEAQRKKEALMVEAIEKSKEIEKVAYEKGYNQGFENAIEDARRETEEVIIPDAKRKAEEIINHAKLMMDSAENDYKEYMESKKEEILMLSIEIAEKILRNEVKNKTALNNLVEEALKLSKGEDNIVIKCNPIHEEEIRNNIQIWKTSYSISGEIFILSTDQLEEGNVIVEKASGQVKVGIDIGLEKIKEVILE